MEKQVRLPKVIPLHLVLKYDPAIIGVVYKRKEADKKTHIYQIFLQ